MDISINERGSIPMNASTTLPIDLYSNGGDPEYTLTIEPLPDNERMILKAFLELQREAAQYMLDVTKHDLDPRPDAYPWHDGGHESCFDKEMTQFDYNGDHVDYNPACAYALATLTDHLCNSDGYRRDELNDDIIAIIQPEFDGDYTSGYRALLAALLSNTEFLENLDTWGHGCPLFSIDYKED